MAENGISNFRDGNIIFSVIQSSKTSNTSHAVLGVFQYAQGTYM